ncbi:MAG: HAMP domain-containing histidine kinase [Cyclobacteriaceae bacterium]|nr:HAMP domain-containing histidine kinase [Cyclobacteriaceae bacterium]
MSLDKRILSVLNVKVAGLLLMVVFATALLILANYASLRITSAVRAYINGESQYSKGQKDASRNLILYLNTSDSLYWNEFLKELKVPIGDSIALYELMREGDDEIIKKGFLQGRNKEVDLDEMIWLFKNFKDVAFMREAIELWIRADKIIGKVDALGKDIHHQVISNSLTSQQKDEFVKQINTNTTELTFLERAFSDSLGSAARRINKYLFYINIIITLLILGSTTAYILIMIRQLREKNIDLININHELDKFLYSASHDLRAPISSMKGLIALSSRELDLREIHKYLGLMLITLDKQDLFIREIIDFSRNKKTEISCVNTSLDSLIKQTISQHQHMPGADTIVFKKEIMLDTINSDPLRLEIILNNMISNAIKYSDSNKEKKLITIKTFSQNEKNVVSVEDNGIGIDKNYISRIYDMFFVTDHNHNGSGLGLYITRETVNKLGGNIQVESEKGIGTKFTVTIPVHKDKSA